MLFLVRRIRPEFAGKYHTVNNIAHDGWVETLCASKAKLIGGGVWRGATYRLKWIRFCGVVGFFGKAESLQHLLAYVSYNDECVWLCVCDKIGCLWTWIGTYPYYNFVIPAASFLSPERYRSAFVRDKHGVAFGQFRGMCLFYLLTQFPYVLLAVEIQNHVCVLGMV